MTHVEESNNLLNSIEESINENSIFSFNPQGFQETAEEVFIRYKSIKGFDHIKYDLPDIDEAINSLLSSVDKRLNTSFEELASEVETSEQAVAIFLALLEAIRWGFVKAEQVNNNELIKIEKNYEE